MGRFKLQTCLAFGRAVTLRIFSPDLGKWDHVHRSPVPLQTPCPPQAQQGLKTRYSMGPCLTSINLTWWLVKNAESHTHITPRELVLVFSHDSYQTIFWTLKPKKPEV